jgi:hypothetical protein
LLNSVFGWRKKRCFKGFSVFGSNQSQKPFVFNYHVPSELKRPLRKHQKKALKKLVKANKGGTFAPATTQTFFNKLASNTN